MIAPLSASSSTLNQVQTRSDGDSDSDWDDDDDFVAKRINIRIKPITQVTPGKVSASMDELRATVGTWKSLNNINLVKPNSRRSQYLTARPPQAVTQKQPQLLLPPQPQTTPVQLFQQPMLPQNHDTYLLPVALAIQECLNVSTILGPGGECTTSLLGHLKMAVPSRIINMDEAQFENNELVLDIRSACALSDVRINDTFVREVSLNGFGHNHSHGSVEENSIISPRDTSSEFPQISTSSSSSNSQSCPRKVVVDMRKVFAYASNTNHKGSYILLPELLNYKIVRSLKQTPNGMPLDTNQFNQTNNFDHAEISTPGGSFALSPIQPIAHWLCDTNVTKVRVDFEYLETKLAAFGLEAKDLRDVRISLQVDGGVESHQSKPQAVWDPIKSKLTWSFGNLSELVCASTYDGITSCLAKFILSDGPSTPNVMEVQFAIQDRTLSGAQAAIDGNSYRITKLKREVRTGQFRCQPPFGLTSVLI